MGAVLRFIPEIRFLDAGVECGLAKRCFSLLAMGDKKIGACSPEWERTSAMGTQSRLLRLSWLLPAALLLSVGAEAGAQEAPSHMNMDAHAQAAPSAVHQSRSLSLRAAAQNEIGRPLIPGCCRAHSMYIRYA